MQAVQCRAFSAIEFVAGVDKEKESGSQVIARPRSKPLKLRDVLALTTLPTIPSLSSPINSHDNTVHNSEVLIRVHYVGIQYPDALQAMGLYQVRPKLPYIPGMDVAGEVVQVTPSSSFKVGDRVFATLLKDGGTGGMAEYVVAPSAWVYPVPDEIHLSQCANIGRNYFAAYHSLKTIGKIKPGNLVLVDGASGGVGMATIQLAKAMGAKVIAGVSQASKVDSPRAAGADVVLVYGKTKAEYRRFKEKVRKACQELAVSNSYNNNNKNDNKNTKTVSHALGVDLIVDMVQGDLFETALVSCVRPLGTIALVGFTAGQKPIRPGIILIKEINVVGSLWGRYAAEFPDQHRENVQDILNLLVLSSSSRSSSISLSKPAKRIFAKDKFLQAFELFENNQGQGNTVISFCCSNTAGEGRSITPSTSRTRSKL